MENVVNTGGKIKNLRWIGLCLVFFMTFISKAMSQQTVDK